MKISVKHLVQIAFYAVIIAALVAINFNQLNLSKAEESPISAPITSPEVTPEPTVTPTPQHHENHDNGGSSNGGSSSGGNNGPSVCGDTKPGTPMLLSVVKVGPNKVMLNWSKPVGPVSSYVLAYGLTPTKMLYGNPNVGNVNSYVVGQLQPGATYFFQVRAANGCAPGDFSNTLGINASGKVLGAKVATGFTPVSTGSLKPKTVVKNTPAQVQPVVVPQQPVVKLPEVNVSQFADNMFGKILHFLYR